MLEHTITRSNHLIDPVVHVWAWEIAVYLFLGGLVAGMMIITGWYQLTGTRRPRSVVPWLAVVGLVLLSLGMLALFLDLEHKLYTWRLYTTFQPTSVMSWGAWILLLVYPVLVASLLAAPPEPLTALAPGTRRTARWFDRSPSVRRVLALTNLGLGVALGIYTGILLSTLGARPFWNTGLLGPLFLLSGLSSAAALGHALSGNPVERVELAQADTVLLAAELVVLVLLVLGLATASRAHAAAAGLVLGGPFTAVFWVVVVCLGILVPMIVQALAATHRVPHTAVPPVLVLVGGLALRFLFVYAGQYSSWAARVAQAVRNTA